MMKCPINCSGSGSSRESRMQKPYPEYVPADVATQNSWRCPSCGCVYNGDGISLGWIDGAMGKQGWTPISSSV